MTEPRPIREILLELQKYAVGNTCREFDTCECCKGYLDVTERELSLAYAEKHAKLLEGLKRKYTAVNGIGGINTCNRAITACQEEILKSGRS